MTTYDKPDSVQQRGGWRKLAGLLKYLYNNYP
jgi:hypothetical protein